MARVFEEQQLDRRLNRGLEAMGIEQPTPVQSEVVPAALAGGDLKVRAETGSGKTLAYLLPIAQNLLCRPAPREAGTLALILVPTRELARQVLKHARSLLTSTGLQVQAITGGADFKYQKSVFRRNPEIIVATPGRLLEHCQRGSADLRQLRCLVLDEADRMLDLGFREEVLEIAAACAEEKQVLLLSATLKHKAMSHIADAILKSPRTISLGQVREAHSSINHQRILADGPQHRERLLTELLRADDYRRALVFANKRATATHLGARLTQAGLRAGVLHGDLSTEQRKAVMQGFTDGRLRILCASDLAARGIDVQDIDLVINYDLPRSGDDYLHRTGRTGRAGSTGLAISLVGAADWNLMISIQRYLNITLEPRTVKGLKAKYKGPKQLKSSGKAAGTRRRKQRDATAKSKTRQRNRKAQGKPRATRANTSATGPAAAPANDGFAPLMKKKPGPGDSD